MFLFFRSLTFKELKKIPSASPEESVRPLARQARRVIGVFGAAFGLLVRRIFCNARGGWNFEKFIEKFFKGIFIKYTGGGGIIAGLLGFGGTKHWEEDQKGAEEEMFGHLLYDFIFQPVK